MAPARKTRGLQQGFMIRNKARAKAAHNKHLTDEILAMLRINDEARADPTCKGTAGLTGVDGVALSSVSDAVIG